MREAKIIGNYAIFNEYRDSIRWRKFLEHKSDTRTMLRFSATHLPKYREYNRCTLLAFSKFLIHPKNRTTFSHNEHTLMGRKRLKRKLKKKKKHKNNKNTSPICFRHRNAQIKNVSETFEAFAVRSRQPDQEIRSQRHAKWYDGVAWCSSV